MGQVSLSMPVLNQLDSTEEPKIITDFTTLQTLVNGNLDTTNLSASAGIVKGQLAAGAGSLGVRNVTANTTAANGDLIIVTGGTPPVIVTLPSPTIHSTVGIVAFGATSTVTAPSGVIVGVGFNAASVTLGTVGSFLVLEANGTNWHVIGGQQDTGWIALTLAAGMGASGSYYTPAARLVGDMVFLRGVTSNQTGSIPSTATVIATVPAGMKPAHFLQLPVMGGTDGTHGSYVGATLDNTTGNIFPLNNSQFTVGASISFDGLSYSLS